MDAGKVSRLCTVALAAALMAGLVACAPAQGPAARNRGETVATGTAVGCTVGSILGGVISIVTGDPLSAPIGCAAGGALGAGLGYLVAWRNEEDAIIEQQLRERSDLAHEVARAYAAQSLETTREIASLQQEIERIAAAHRRGRISRRAYTDRIAPLSNRAAELTQRAEATHAAIERHEAAATALRDRGWNIDELDRALEDIRATNERERRALEGLQRALAHGRG
jgi:hypothetical protein